MRVLAVAFLLFSNLALAQTKDELQQRLDKYNEATMPEFVSLHLDRENYFAGDRIWYAIYLNNTPRSASSVSAVVYVELRDSRDSVVTRQKIKCREGFGHGDMLLSGRLRTGNYKLLAYTLWMKNNQDVERYQAMIPVINLELPVVINSGGHAPQRGSLLKVTSSAAGQFSVQVAGSGKLVAFDREEILLVADVSSGQQVPFSCGDADHDAVSFALLDESRAIIEMKEVECLESVEFAIDPGRLEAKTRQEFDVSVLLSHKSGKPLSGNISVSVRSGGPEWDQLPESTEKPWLGLAEPSFKGGTRKEMFVYPADQASLKPVLQLSEPPVPFALVIDTSRAHYLEEIGTNRNILRAFSAQPYFEREAGYNIPFNISYQTRDYQSLPTIEEFIREVVPQVRIRKASGERRLFLRYVDDNSLVYYFKQPALVLMDGFVYTGNDDFLQLPLADIDRIDLTWGMREINSMGVFSLADNGIISINSKSRSLKKEGQELWKEYHHPLVFSQSGHENPGDEVPALTEPVYWNPLVRVNGKAKVTVQAPDRPGEMIIEVHGLSDSGHKLSGIARVTVVVDGN